MDRYRLKNIIILILVLVNLFLIGALAIRLSARESAQHTTREQLVELFAADGIALFPEAISSVTPPAGRSLLTNTAVEHQAAAALLGSSLSYSDQGGGLTTYTSEQGAAMFRSNGDFDVKGTLAQTDATAFCKGFCKEFGYEVPVFQLDEQGNGSSTTTRLYEGVPVFNCSVTFSITDGILTSVSGTLMADPAAEITAPPLSAVAALTAFQQHVRRGETVAVVSSVTDLHPCYELQGTVSMSLAPAWCIVTNTGEYYVNCYTGAVTSP